jgi:hypothetical protein
MQLENAISFGLPEVDDRYHIWRVPLLSRRHTINVAIFDERASLMAYPSLESKALIL